MMAKTRKNSSGDELEKEGPPPTMLLSKMLPEDLMCNAVLGFLDRASVASFMAVEEFSQVFRVHRCFCKDHGTHLGQVCTGMPTSPTKQCADCEMPKIGKLRCGKCDDFSKWNHFGNCNVCEKPECNVCKFFCLNCCREFCFQCKDSSHREECSISFCRDCRDTFCCERCEEFVCLECKDVAVCEKCDKTVCIDCEWIPYCTKCRYLECCKCARRDSTVKDATRCSVALGA